jgi:hypothetical protein
MNDKVRTTLGATAALLKANGYTPRALNGDDSYRFADDVAVVLCAPKSGGNLAALTVCVKDKAMRADVLALLARHGVGKGPVRTDSAGNETHVIALAEYAPMLSRQSKPFKDEDQPVLAFDCFTRMGLETASAVIRLDGIWRASLLDTPRDALPSLDETAIEAVFAHIDRMHAPQSEYKLPPKNPNRATGAYARGVIEPWSANGAVDPSSHRNPWPNAS